MGLNFNGTSVTAVNYNGTDLTKVIYNGTTVWEKLSANYLCFTANTAGSTVSLSAGEWSSILYSTDSSNWNNYSAATTLTLTNAGDKLYFRGNNTCIDAVFLMSGSIAASGNVNYLLSYAGDITDLTGRDRCFSRLFIDNTALTNASDLELPATTLAEYCYMKMFAGCINLITAPELPAMTLADYCYAYMFQDCTALTTPPSLPATTLAGLCYAFMFRRCTALTAVTALPALYLNSQCYYYMFAGCSNIKISQVQTGIYLNAYRIPTSGTATREDSNFGTSMFRDTGGTYKSSAGMNSTFYTSNTIV